MNALIIGSLLLSSMLTSVPPSSPPTHLIIDSSANAHLNDFNKYIYAVDHKSVQVKRLIDRRSEKVINRLLKLENRMKSRLAQKDSVAANEIFNGPINLLKNLKSGLQQRFPRYSSLGNHYIDSLSSTLDFLGAQKLTNNPSLTAVKEKVADLNSSFTAAADIKSYINAHRKELKEKLSGYTAFSKDLLKINKQAYYYGEQVKEYKEILKDRKQAEAKAIKLLSKTPAYTDFIKRHSQLASLLNNPVTAGGSVPTLEGLQTRSQVEALIQQRIGGDPTARQAVTQQMDQARAKLNELKSKYPDVENAGEMPDFKPNPMKTKSFLQRLEFGGNIQFQKSNRYFPTTADIAGQVGYKFHKNGTAGIGVSYKLGLGTGWNHIAMSHQGVGLRSFADWKLKSTFYINGGFEQNHMSTISRLDQLKDWSGLQGSALLGVSKKYKIGPKVKGNIMFLYDFLAKQNTPTTSPIKIRLGYTW
ncbi:hypothetical protein [Chitinophaga rhizophila]|uniref:Uncharacterized protein n=1 Tax=Chitinophaga rhizophila TaxID=2866212 RepID=A0ABS7GAQ4_9BACT|nr:hypothetical protein [Chitinophaga rhizophila]MBW8683894.1 hypothetical protein [Chitinophaga rhizophila]